MPNDRSIQGFITDNSYLVLINFSNGVNGANEQEAGKKWLKWVQLRIMGTLNHLLLLLQFAPFTPFVPFPNIFDVGSHFASSTTKFKENRECQQELTKKVFSSTL